MKPLRLTLRALAEAHRPYRALILQALAELEASNTAHLFPVAVIMKDATQNKEARSALRSLYRSGLIKGHTGKYGLTALGRKTYKVYAKKPADSNVTGIKWA